VADTVRVGLDWFVLDPLGSEALQERVEPSDGEGDPAGARLRRVRLDEEPGALVDLPEHLVPNATVWGSPEAPRVPIDAGVEIGYRDTGERWVIAPISGRDICTLKRVQAPVMAQGVGGDDRSGLVSVGDSMVSDAGFQTGVEVSLVLVAGRLAANPDTGGRNQLQAGRRIAATPGTALSESGAGLRCRPYLVGRLAAAVSAICLMRMSR
jgi:hypothetical protein